VFGWYCARAALEIVDWEGRDDGWSREKRIGGWDDGGRLVAGGCSWRAASTKVEDVACGWFGCRADARTENDKGVLVDLYVGPFPMAKLEQR
jgi:hypothetical protein